MSKFVRVTPEEQARKYIYYMQTHPDSKKLEYISGKWFYDKNEIRNIDKWLYQMCDKADTISYKSLHAYFDIGDKMRIDKWKVAFITMSRDEHNTYRKWYEPKYALIGKNTDLRHLKLPFALTQKQLKIINILLYSPNEDVLFICSGQGGTGKTTFGNIIKQLFENDTAAIQDESFTNKFAREEALKHRLIYFGDFDEKDINFKGLKPLVSREEILVQAKGQTPYMTKCQSVFLMNCNQPPRIDLGDTGLLRRIIYYYRNDKIESPDLGLRDKIYTEDELAIIASYAYHEDMTNWKDEFEKETRTLLLQANSVYIFKECASYETYKTNCLACGFKPYNKSNYDEVRDLMKRWGVIAS